MDHALRRTRLAARLDDVGADAMLVTHLPNVRYLSGYSGSNGQVLIARDDACFFTDGRYIEQSRLEVPDMERVIYGGGRGFGESFEVVCKELDASTVAFEQDAMVYREYASLQERVETFVPADDEVGRLRWAKDPEELRLIERAQAITDEGYELLLPRLKEGMTEREAALVLERAMQDVGADGLAFETIVAFGESAAEPHHSPTDRDLRRGDIVKLDFGALSDGYHSDMTRTVAFGEPDSKLREIYEVVQRSQQAGVDALRAGIEGREVDAISRGIIEDAGYGEAFTHGLGHGVGLEVHEGPNLASTVADPMPVGAVVTVEPGIYLAGLGGVRIEDMVEVTETGSRVLPRATKELVVL